ncbi:hypothetical protein AB0D38_35330, partial [Streptomyces sp. NPDC048279]|uniref:hypothetical protein n=1 Tax=Streptomyces sp. NPDC048279 TaxID=3154714 RepID=UPI00344914FA
GAVLKSGTSWRHLLYAVLQFPWGRASDPRGTGPLVPMCRAQLRVKSSAFTAAWPYQPWT